MELFVKIPIFLTLGQVLLAYASMTELRRKSHTEEFEGMSALFRAMSSSPNDGYTYNWSVVSFSTDGKPDSGLNCTVLYLDQCTSWNRCRQTCLKTGATSYRWFHDGCCECVGEHCMNYGINESKCRLCPEPGFEDEED
ncbi:protein twisted gastrulation [Drosophila eugracilis]|uniref:protein twisted gastrulation n=1 Tax=Drosophila eugracilis TaxID=29029 RepID=UPI0007E7020D|nr:protein twisted gastrulation [Drosophila eugracilis]